MIDLNEAYKIIDSIEYKPKTEKVFLCDAYNKILAENIITDIDFPHRSIAKIPGYACRTRDLKNTLNVISRDEFLSNTKFILPKNSCVWINKDEYLPAGANVIIQENDFVCINENTIQLMNKVYDLNIVKAGFDSPAESIVLYEGTKLGYKEISLLAATGNIEPGVYENLKAVVFTFGDNYIEPTFMPFGNKIRNSSASLLVWNLKSLGVQAEYQGMLTDESDVEETFNNSYENCDFIMINALSKEAGYLIDKLKFIGYDILFDKVNINNFSNFILAKKKDKYLVGIFGDSLSIQLNFELICKPLIYKLNRSNYKPKHILFMLDTSFTYDNVINSNTYIPAYFSENGGVISIEYSGEGNAYVLSQTQVFLKIEKEFYNSNELVKGIILF